jgi:hypothetical protein
MESGDPRTIRTTILDGPMVGDAVIAVEEVEIDGLVLHVPRTIPGVAEYLVVREAERQAEILRPQLTQGLNYSGGSIPFQPNEALVYSMQAAAGTAVLSATVGLEAFANHHIRRVAGDDPARWERSPFDLPLHERFGDVLPNLMGVPRPTAEQWWRVLRRVQALSGLVRHPETGAQRRRGLDGERTITERLYRGEYRGATEMMEEVFEYFSPSWLPPSISP